MAEERLALTQHDPNASTITTSGATNANNDDEDSNKEDDDVDEEKPTSSNKDSTKNRKRGRQLEIYTNAVDFPKEKVLTKRLEYLIKFLTQPPAPAKRAPAKAKRTQSPSSKRTQSPSAASRNGNATTASGDTVLKIVKKKTTTAKAKPKAESTSSNPFDKPKQRAKRPAAASASTGTTPPAERATMGGKCPRTTPIPTELSPRSQSPVAERRSPPAAANGAAKKYVEIPRHADGSPIFPIPVGKMRVESLGEIVFEHPEYHTSKYIWPVGFKSVRSYHSFLNPENRVEYVCEILRDGDKPSFKVTAADAPDEPSIGSSTTAAWSTIIKKVNEKCSDPSAKRAFTSVSGPEYFGMAKSIIRKLVQELPNANLCKKYRFIEFVKSEPSKRPPAKKQKVNNNDNEDHDEPPKPKISFGFKSAATGSQVPILN